jgi:hypothetical protein
VRGHAYVGLMAVAVLAVGLGGCSGIRDSLGIGKHPPDEFQVVSRAPLSMPPDFNLRPPQPGVPRPQEGTPRDQAQSALFNAGGQTAPAEPGAPAPAAAPTVPVEAATTIDSIPTLADAAGPATAAPEASSTISSFEGTTVGTVAPVAAPAPAPPSGPVSAGEAALLQHSGAAGADPSIRQTVDRETKDIREGDSRFIDRLIFWQSNPEPGVIIDPAKEQQRLQENAALGKPLTEGETPIIQRKRRAWLEGIF